METRLRTILNAINDFKNVPSVPINSTQGSNCYVEFLYLNNHDVEECYDGKSYRGNTLEVAHSQLLPFKDKTMNLDNPKNLNYLSAMSTLQKEFARRNLHSPFLHHFLFYAGNGSGEVSLRAYKDLSHYMDFITHAKNRKQLIKNILAQLFLGIKTLHDHDYVHRDIKPANVLVFEKRGRLYLRIADIGDIVSVNDKNKSINTNTIMCTPSYAAPEIIDCFKERFENVELYKHVNLKASDCYSLGKTVEKLILAPSRDVIDLIIQLTDPNPDTRLTLQGALENKIFGETTQERESYFKKVVQQCQDDLYIDSYYVPRYPQENDTFYLMPAKIKEIYHLAEKIDLQLEFIKNYKYNLNLNESFKVKQILTMHIGTLNQLIDTGLKSAEVMTYSDLLIQLKNAVNEHMVNLQRNFNLNFINVNNIYWPSTFFTTKKPIPSSLNAAESIINVLKPK